MTQHNITRRSAIKQAAAGAALLLAGRTGQAVAAAEKPAAIEKFARKLKNSAFYKPAGGFDAAKAKQAYYDLMQRFRYPIYDRLKTDEFWATDFGLNDFASVGMGGIFWWNDKANSYFGHEIFLLPGQMIVEHSHVAAGDVKAKMEAWQVRHGSIYNFGEGAPTVPLPVLLPKSQDGFITSPHCELLKLGGMAALNRAGAKHFMMGGPAGAIVTEYATYHDNAGLRFTNPGVKF
jgi:D-lyxose ketol-isomerase